eukprot:COSAG02_NODE_59046_length_275_cov_0.880682_1_plen_91_part_11
MTDGDYTLSGCSPIICTRPSSLAGYDVGTLVESNLDLSAGAFDVSVQCGEGYEGSAAASACMTDGDYTLSGCSPIICTRPSSLAGYDVGTL